MFALIFLTILLLNISNVKSQNCDDGWHRFQNKCFWKSNLKATRDENEQNCKSMNAELVTIKSKLENDFLKKFTKFYSYYNLGARRVMTGINRFTWSDKSPVTFTAWNWCEPNGLWNPMNKCVIAYIGNKVEWFDADCRTPRFQMCQKPITSPTNPSIEISDKLITELKRELSEIKKSQSESMKEMRSLVEIVQHNISQINDRRVDRELINNNNDSRNWSELMNLLLRIDDRLQNYTNNNRNNESDQKLLEIQNSTKNMENKLSNLKQKENLNEIKELHKKTIESVKSLIYELLAKKSLKEDDGMKRLHDRLTTIIETLTAEREEWRKKENTSFDILVQLLKKMMEKDAEDEKRREIDFRLLSVMNATNV